MKCSREVEDSIVIKKAPTEGGSKLKYGWFCWPKDHKPAYMSVLRQCVLLFRYSQLQSSKSDTGISPTRFGRRRFQISPAASRLPACLRVPRRSPSNPVSRAKPNAIQEFLPQKKTRRRSLFPRAASQLPMCSWGPAAHFRILYRATEMWLIQEFLRQDLGAVASKSRRPPRAFPHACGSRGVRFRILYRATEI